MSLIEQLQANSYGAYAYSYPHKTAYRPLDQPVELAPLWVQEKRDALFLYLHIPFCEMRCGFCNLFTVAKPAEDLPQQYVAALLRQMQLMPQILGEHSIVRLAFGGGTPSYLTTSQLDTLFNGIQRCFTLDMATTPTSFEVSPKTLDSDKLQLLKQFGVDRLSIGVQSFIGDETQTLIRPQSDQELQSALDMIRSAGFGTLNLDLIYGIPQQTEQSFLYSIEQALRWRPEEFYLYPLYVRELTGLEKVQQRGMQHHAQDKRQALYRVGRDRLLAEGYQQLSMRMFKRPDAPGKDAPVYCCQSDGMLGLGSGARAYTRELHYSTEYAVGRRPSKEIIQQFNQRDTDWFRRAYYGFVMNTQERQQRFVIQSLLSQPGLDLADYRQRFDNADALQDIPLLAQLRDAGLAELQQGQLVLNAQGIALSDSIGPALISEPVRRLMDEYAAR